MLRLISNETGLDQQQAKKYFDEANQDTKVALCMIKAGLTLKQSQELLEKFNGRVRQALISIGKD